MILRLRRVRPEEEVEEVADPRDRAEQVVDADIAGHPREMEFRHAEIARLPDQPGAHRRGDRRRRPPGSGRDHVEAEPAVGAGHGESALEQASPSPRSAAAPRPGRGRSAAGRRRASNWSCGSASRVSPRAARDQRRRPGGGANGIGPEAGEPRRDQRPAHRRRQRDERREVGQVSGRRSASWAWRSAGVGGDPGRRAAPRRRRGRRPRLASQVKWRRYQVASIGRRDLVDEPEIGRRAGRHALRLDADRRQSRRRWAKSSR